MYESFFELDELPFELTPDPRFLWLSEAHQEGLASLYYGITRRKGFILLTGEVGTGKTTLLRAAIDSIPRDVDTGVVLNTAALSRIDLLKLIVAEFQISGRFETKADWEGWDHLQASLPQAELHDLIVELRSLSQGVGTFTWSFDHLQELTGRLASEVIERRAEAKAQ